MEGGYIPRTHSASTLLEPAEFTYSIGSYQLSLAQIKHGILRGNKPQPGGFFAAFSKKDQRLQLAKYSYQTSLKVLCLFNEENKLPKKLIIFNENDFNEKLVGFCKNFLTKRIYYDNLENEIILPKVLKHYACDFNHDDLQILQWVPFFLIGPVICLHSLGDHLQAVCGGGADPQDRQQVRNQYQLQLRAG